jgi:hypothetical protein
MKCFKCEHNVSSGRGTRMTKNGLVHNICPSRKHVAMKMGAIPVRSCLHCGTEITNRCAKNYCSTNCWYNSRRARIPRRRCPVCRIEFILDRKVSKDKSFCTRECFNIHQTKRPIKHCIICHSEIRRKGTLRPSARFCSQKCAGISRSRLVQCECAQCGKGFTRCRAVAERSARKFCSRECLVKYSRGHHHPLWRGNRRQDRGSNWAGVSTLARDRDAHICQVCGNPEKRGQKLDVDHIVPFRLVLENELVNLISTCKYPCHVTKTSGAEVCFLAGDILGFKSKLTASGWPMDRVDAALSYWQSLRKHENWDPQWTKKPCSDGHATEGM